MHDPREEHIHALKRILRYVQGTMDFGLHLCPTSTSTLISYTNAYCVFLGDNLISWSTKHQTTLSRSSAKA